MAEPTAWDLAQIVGRYFRIRAAHPGQGIAGSVHPPITDPNVFTQLAADAEHSDLLRRLFNDAEPWDYDDWLAHRPDVSSPG